VTLECLLEQEVREMVGARRTSDWQPQGPPQRDLPSEAAHVDGRGGDRCAAYAAQRRAGSCPSSGGVGGCGGVTCIYPTSCQLTAASSSSCPGSTGGCVSSLIDSR